MKRIKTILELTPTEAFKLKQILETHPNLMLRYFENDREITMNPQRYASLVIEHNCINEICKSILSKMEG